MRYTEAELEVIARKLEFKWIAMYGMKNANKLSLAVRRRFKKRSQSLKSEKVK